MDWHGSLLVRRHTKIKKKSRLARHPPYDYRYLLFGLKIIIMIIITLGHRQMARVKSLSKVRNLALVCLENRKGQAKYMLIWSIFFPKERFTKWLANKRL